VLAAPAASVRNAVERATFSPLETARVLAPPAASVHDTMLRVAASRLEAALVLAAPAASVHDAVPRVALSRLGAALVLAAFTSAMRLAVPTGSSKLGAALQLTLPLAHGAPPGTPRWLPPKPQIHCGAITAVTHPPLSPQRSNSAHRPHRRRWQCESRSDVAACLGQRWSTALGRGTYGVRVVGLDGHGLLSTLRRQVRRLLARRAASPKPSHRHSTPLPGVHSTTEGHLGVDLLF
jgi:hypothetical protein